MYIIRRCYAPANGCKGSCWHRMQCCDLKPDESSFLFVHQSLAAASGGEEGGAI